MVLRAAHPGRVFLERAQAGDGLAGVEQDRAGAGDRLDIAAGQGRDAGQVLDGVERRALGGEQRPRLAATGAADRRRPRPLSPSSASRSISTSGSSARKKASATGRPATTIASRLSITPVKRASAGITAAEVMSPRLAQILGERGGDEGVEIEAVETKAHRRR